MTSDAPTVPVPYYNFNTHSFIVGDVDDAAALAHLCVQSGMFVGVMPEGERYLVSVRADRASSLRSIVPATSLDPLDPHDMKELERRASLGMERNT